MTDDTQAPEGVPVVEAAAESKAGEPGFSVVAIGASAGGLAAMNQFFANVPATSGMAYVVIQHLDPTHASHLSELLDRQTPMPVGEAYDGAAVEPEHVYVIPPGMDMTVSEGRLRLTAPVTSPGRRHPIDLFFRSLAADAGARAVGVVLSGTGTEGTLGLREIKAAGGLCLVQDGETAEHDGMPGYARASGLADFVLAPGAMPDQILARAWKPALVEPGTAESSAEDLLKQVMAALRDETGHDLSLYKQSTIVRRLERRMVVQGVERLGDYLALLRETPEEARALLHEALISVSSFFRDPEAFTALRNQVLHPLLENRESGQEVRIWVPGCASGEEAYSIAILAREEISRLGRTIPVQIFATDIDAEAVETARTGLYPASIAGDVPEALLRRHFLKEGDKYRVRQAVREMLIFAEQNVIRDAPFSRLDLISCRNLLIYLTPQLQRRLLPVFHYALRDTGYLFLGSSETVGPHEDLFTPADRKWKIYRPHTRAASRPAPSPVAAAGPGGRQRTGQTRPRAGPATPGFRDVVENLLLKAHAPAAVLVNANGDILYVHGRTGAFLEPASGDAKFNALLMARDGLRAELSTALRQALREERPVHQANLRPKSDEAGGNVTVTVHPVTEPENMRGLALVVFTTGPGEAETPTKGGTGASATASAASDPAWLAERVRTLEQELHDKEAHLQNTIEELESANEELRSTNEELQSANEELQSTNEEHETTKEELQSANEELTTVNAELETKVRELATAKDDMNNILASAEIGTLFLDQTACVQRFTPAAANLLNLRSADVGRPLAHLATNLEYDGLVADCQAVLESLVPRHTEARARDGCWYSVRILPYRTSDNVIDGAVVTLMDITERKALETEAELASVMRDTGDAVIIQTFDGRITVWNSGAEHLYGYTADEAQALSFYDLLPDAAGEAHRRLVRRVARDGHAGPEESTRLDRDSRERVIRLTAVLVRGDRGEATGVATIERDISVEHAERSRARQLQRLYQALPVPVVLEDTEGIITDLNEAATATFGWRAGERAGDPAATLVSAQAAPHVAAARARCHAAEAVHDLAIHCPDSRGTLVPARLSLVPLTGPDGMPEAVAAFYHPAPGGEGDTP